MALFCSLIYVTIIEMLILLPPFRAIQTSKGKYLKFNNMTMVFTDVRSLSKQKSISLYPIPQNTNSDVLHNAKKETCTHSQDWVIAALDQTHREKGDRLEVRQTWIQLTYWVDWTISVSSLNFHIIFFFSVIATATSWISLLPPLPPYSIFSIQWPRWSF